jgi:hypothetical protein
MSQKPNKLSYRPELDVDHDNDIIAASPTLHNTKSNDKIINNQTMLLTFHTKNFTSKTQRTAFPNPNQASHKKARWRPSTTTLLKRIINPLWLADHSKHLNIHQSAGSTNYISHIMHMSQNNIVSFAYSQCHIHTWHSGSF